MKSRYKAIRANGEKIDEHRHIMQEHLGRKLESNECVHHVNGDPRDNRIENLEIISRSEHAKLHVTSEQVERLRKFGKRKGEENWSTILTTTQAKEIKQRLANGETWWQIWKSDDYSIGYTAIRKIAYGQTWKHI